jgi:hypothetical protein
MGRRALSPESWERVGFPCPWSVGQQIEELETLCIDIKLEWEMCEIDSGMEMEVG